jgi:PPIC-type PPIASE domain
LEKRDQRVIDRLRKLVQEPLVHFIVLALLIFVVYRLLNPVGEARPDKIEISQARIEQLAGLFAKTWQRSPTPEELKGLIDDFVKEEISYREAVALGLDKDDTVIRRRMRQKLEFLTSSEADPPPSEGELTAFLNQHPDKYATETLVKFSQVYFDPARRGSSLDANVAAALELLRSDSTTDATTMGDATMLPHAVDLSRTSVIARDFGSDFAAAISKIDIGHWTGPIRSSFGTHIVLVSERKVGGPVTLEAARMAVTRDLLEERRISREAARYAELLKKYTVVIEAPARGTQDQSKGR